MTSSDGSIFRVTGHLCGEFTGPRWIPLTKASDAELWCFFICVWINDWVNNREAGDLRRYRAHYDVTLMQTTKHRQTMCVFNVYTCVHSYLCIGAHIFVFTSPAYALAHNGARPPAGTATTAKMHVFLWQVFVLSIISSHPIWPDSVIQNGDKISRNHATYGVLKCEGGLHLMI